MRDFRQLRVWEESHSLALIIYKITKEFPKEELFTLTSQMRRSAASVPSNIAEGCGRGSSADYARFLQIALGSATELDYQLILARDLGYVNPSKYDRLNDKMDKVKRQLAKLLRKVRQTV